jgi:membrane protein implicated in regulation of membrane protease activity
MIALPMTFILMNEVVGAAIIDAAIPAMYSAIFILGAYLYSISLLALLLTFCLAIAAVFYWTLVYRPASKAHSLRKEKLKRMRCASHSPSVDRQRAVHPNAA